MPAPLTNKDLRRFYDLSKVEIIPVEGDEKERVATARKALAKWEYIYQHDGSLYCANTKFWE